MAIKARKRFLILVLAVVAGWVVTADCAPVPYRFLLVIGNQWKDPASRLIEPGGEFPVVVTLLKTWGLPFDILRLDQQRFDRYYLTDRQGRPRYGTIIWDADANVGEPKNLALLSTLVRDHGVGLVVLGDTVASPQVAAVAGLEYAGEYRRAEGLAFSDGHFITCGLAGSQKEFPASDVSGSRVSAREATAVVSCGPMPFVTVREVPGGGRVVWLDAHRASARIGTPVVRDLFKRSLVWTQGYALYAEYPRSILLFMDDFGTSDRSYPAVLALSHAQ